MNETDFVTIHPNEIKHHGTSVSVIYHNLFAHRETDGSVTVTINETLHTTRGYYEHLATDITGENFISTKNTSYFTDSKGLYQIKLPANSVSSDGYIYLKFSRVPEDHIELLDDINYKIPVNYDKNKVINSDFRTLTPDEIFYGSISADIFVFTANAIRLANNDIEINVNIQNCNTALLLKHLATSKDEDIYLPQKDNFYNLDFGVQNDKTYSFTVPANSVSTDGYIYFEVYLNSPSYGLYKLENIKLKIN